MQEVSRGKERLGCALSSPSPLLEQPGLSHTSWEGCREPTLSECSAHFPLLWHFPLCSVWHKAVQDQAFALWLEKETRADWGLSPASLKCGGKKGVMEESCVSQQSHSFERQPGVTLWEMERSTEPMNQSL